MTCPKLPLDDVTLTLNNYIKNEHKVCLKQKAEMSSLSCAVCGKDFFGRRDARTCSARCRKRLQRLHSVSNRRLREIDTVLVGANTSAAFASRSTHVETGRANLKSLVLIVLIALAAILLLVMIYKSAAYVTQHNTGWAG